MEDNQIIQLFFDRDESALKETEMKYGRLCYKIAYDALNDADDAWECANDTYLTLWNAIPPAKPDNFAAYLCKIARNHSLKKLEYRSAKKRSAPPLVSLSELEETLPDASYRFEVEESELGKLINEFLHKQKKAVRRVFVRRYYFHEGLAEIAERYGFTQSKVKSMLFHTRNKLKKFLSEKGVCV